MAWLSPIANCKITDTNAFLTALTANVSTGSIYTQQNGIGQYYKQDFLRAEQLTKVCFNIIVPDTTTVPANDLIISLGQFKSFTVTIATPAVFTITSHGYANGDSVRLQSTGTLPTGLAKGTEYFVGNVATNTFNLYDTYANAIAGGATGRINTTGSAGSGHVCIKIIESKTYTANDIRLAGVLQHRTFFMSTGWTTTVDATANKWCWYAYPTNTNPTAQVWAFGSSGVSNAYAFAIGFGTTTASAVSGTDAIVFDKQVDMTTGFTLKSHWISTYVGICGLIPAKLDGDPFLEPQLLVDPTKATPALITIDGVFHYASHSSMAFGKPLRFTSTLASGATSATLTSNFDGTSGTYLVHLMPLTNSDSFAQVNMTFTNGSTAVTFSALANNYIEDAGVCITGNYEIYLRNHTGASGTSGTTFWNSMISEVRNNSFMFFGEVTRKTFSAITADSAIGTNTITVEGGTGWKANDTLFIGGNSGGVKDSTNYVISSVTPSGLNDVITLTTNIVSANRKIGGYVRLMSAIDGAIRFTAQQATFLSSNNSRLLSDGSTIKYISSVWGITQLGSAATGHANAYTKKAFVYNTDSHATAIVNKYGLRMENISTYQNEGTNPIVFSKTPDATPNMSYVLLKNIFGIADNDYGNASFSPQIGFIENFFIHHVTWGTPSISATKDVSVKNFRIWSASNRVGSYACQFINFYTDTFEDFYCDNAISWGVQIGASAYAKVKNMYLGTFSVNTYDFAINTGTFNDIEFNNVGNFTFDRTNQPNMVTGTGIKFTDRNGVTNETLIVQKFGDVIVSGTGLSDTTAHNGNQCLRFRSLSTSGKTEWEQVIPTGNIQNKDMMIGIWVNVANANYWAGTHEMPRLTLNYDDGTIAYAQAAQVTGWQYIFVPFTPTTTFASVKAKLTTMTAATTTDADVYFADYSVLYPAGYTLNLGSFNNLTAGYPTVPTISTSISALDVWAANPSSFGASTVGDKVNKIKTDTGLIPALL